jgi:hypothetical protein
VIDKGFRKSLNDGSDSLLAEDQKKDGGHSNG